MRRLAAAAAGKGLHPRVLVLAQGVVLAMVSKKAEDLPLTPQQRIV